MNTKLSKKNGQSGFSLIELLMVLTIISIMAALIINAFSNASQDSREVVARQQQAVLKGALDNTISQYMVGGKTVAEARKFYMYANSTGGTLRTQSERLDLVSDYLDEDTYNHLSSRSSSTEIKSAAMEKTGQYIQFQDWPAATSSNRNTYPKVTLN